MKRLISTVLCFMLVFTQFLPAAFAASTITWTGSAGNGSWHTAGNWDLAQVPVDDDYVTIPASSVVNYASGETSVRLICAGNLTVSGGTLKLASGNSSLTDGKLDGAGDIAITTGGNFSWSGGSIEGSGSLIIENNANLYATTPSSLDRYLVNNGSLLINGSSLRLTGGVEGSGNFSIQENKTLELGGNESYNLSSNVSNMGTLKISDACTSVKFNSGYTQQNTGTLEFDIGGLSDFTQLEVTGTALLNGELKINILDGYVPQTSDTFEIMTYGSKTGTFSSIESNLPGITFVLDYFDNSLTLTVAAGTGNACKIGSTEYATLDDALTAVQSGETIKLLRNIDYVRNIQYDGGISIDGANITFDLNGYTLNVNNSVGPGLKAVGGGNVEYINGGTTGSFNVTGYEHGVWAEDAGTVVRVNNVTSGGSTAYNFAVFSKNGAEVIVENDVIVSGPSSRGISANGGVVAVGGNVSLTAGAISSFGMEVFNGGSVIVEGSVMASGTGVTGIRVVSDSSVDVGGNVTAMGSGSKGISVTEANVSVDGDVGGRYMGIHATKAAVIRVAGNVASTATDYAVDGSSFGIAINDDCEITVDGNVDSHYTGIYIMEFSIEDPEQYNHSKIYINGVITAPEYTKIGDTSLNFEDYSGITPSGYRIYEAYANIGDDAFPLGAVYVKDEGMVPVVPFAPLDFTATPGNGQVALSWTAPASDGGAAISGYEVSGDNGSTWVTASTSTSHTFTGLTNGTEYTFKVRAVNSAGNGADARATATPTAPAPTQPGQLYTWGNNVHGQLGDGTIGFAQNKSTPTHIGTGEDWTTVSAGCQHTVALKSDGSLWTWGDNHEGRLGDGTEELRKDSPVRIGSDNDWAAAEAGDNHTVALKTDGSLWAWGGNNIGQLGDGTTENRNVPTLIDDESTWIAVSAGFDHTLALQADGSLWAWGSNSKGQFGCSDISYSKIPIQISTEEWAAVSAGTKFTVALKANGSLWTWGWNNVGQLGDGTVADKNVPTQVGSDTWLAAAAGENHVVAIKTDGSLWAWGGNEYGELGNGSSDGVSDPPAHPVPARIGTDTDWTSVTAGYMHNAAFKTDGSLWLWGLNSSGQLGDNTIVSKLTPQRLDGAGTWLAIACGGSHTVATLEAGLTVPTAPQNFTATPGDTQVVLSWTAPESDGGAAISGYEVSGDNGSTWVTASTSTSHTFTSLTNGTEYTFKVRAVNSAGNGAEASATATPTAPEFAGGNGSEEEPYLIATVDQLNNVRNYLGTEHNDKHFKLSANLNLDVAPFNSGDGWEPIGTSASPFTGTFDGNEYTISGLVINQVGAWNVRVPAGLFGYTGAEAEICDLALEDVDVTGCYYVGGLVGNNNGEITNVNGSGNVVGEWDTGGLLGLNNGSIAHSDFVGTVTCTYEVEYGDWTGGLVGYNLGTVTNCHTDAIIVSEGDSIGGLAGENMDGTITESYSSGTITGYDYTGGLAGDNSGEITACYSTCTVNGDSDVGGLVGGNSGPIATSFAVGVVNGASRIGGLVGSSTDTTVTGCYWDTETSGQSTSACGTGKSTAEMKEQATYEGWDFDDAGVWGINSSDNDGYPFLRWQGYEHGQTSEDVCEIGATKYATLDAALAAVTSGQTIKLLKNITHTSSIEVDGKTIYFELGNYDLLVDTSANPDDSIYSIVTVRNGGKIRLAGTGTGKFNIQSSSPLQFYGIRVLDANSEVTVNNVDVTGAGAMGIYMYGSGSALDGGTITVNGHLNADDMGIWVNAKNGNVIINGDITSGHSGVRTATNPGTSVTVNGNITVLGTTSQNLEGAGILASGKTTVNVTGDVTGQGANYIGVYALGGTITVGGNVVSSGIGAKAKPNYTYGNGAVTIDGSLSAGTPFIMVGTTEKTGADITEPTTKTGFLTYTDDVSVVWIGSVGDPVSATHTVNFYSDSSLYASKTVTSGSALGANLPSNPTRSGYSFGGWFSGQNGTGTSFTSSTIINADVDLYAKWTYNGGGSSGGRSTPVTPVYKADVEAEDGTKTILPVTVDKDFETASIDSDSQSFAQGGTAITIPSIPDIDTYSISIPVLDLSTTDAQGQS